MATESHPWKHAQTHLGGRCCEWSLSAACAPRVFREQARPCGHRVARQGSAVRPPACGRRQCPRLGQFLYRCRSRIARARSGIGCGPTRRICSRLHITDGRGPQRGHIDRPTGTLDGRAHDAEASEILPSAGSSQAAHRHEVLACVACARHLRA
ncbi:hypothetical protein FA09DRAFT_192935 [Tilletiopsis washingtonensis]|uniref:Uncharacterized protein n=1 Tax=Tilletiopsis washingtonensis TaxID=58919 RepID=A0A316ZFS6_9BASI|nr:hypothetical protein FA09DRAFT_192935 [Tilletiopsis washingtonensis]PWO00608.1 hypothetical protein FA09DRAFT_192935 [Tilletiopsis washingtonensis]